MKVLSIILVTFISLIGVVIFELFSFPVPWMLGPLFAVLLSQFFIKKVSLEWPSYFRNIGLVIVGAAIGHSFQFDLFDGMGWLILFMLILNLTLVLLTTIMALGVEKFSHIPLKTAITCTVPGGISQIVTFAEEEKDINLAIVTYFHVIRVISIVMLIPFFVSGHVVKGDDHLGFSISALLPLGLLILACWVFALIGKKLKLPVPFFLTPVFLVLILQLTSFNIPEVPVWLLHIAQLFIGAYIGFLLKPSMLKLGARVITIGIVSALVLLGITLAQGWMVSYFFNYSLPAGFLSTAAGGLDQMSLLATAIGTDISAVTVFQMFRLLFIFIIVFPMLKVVCNWIDRRNGQIQDAKVDVSN